MNMMRKGQIQGIAKEAVKERVKFMHHIFGGDAYATPWKGVFLTLEFLQQHDRQE